MNGYEERAAFRKECEQLLDEVRRAFHPEEAAPKLTLVDLREQLDRLETDWLPTIGDTPSPRLTLIQGGDAA